jgi:hypothetical protein
MQRNDPRRTRRAKLPPLKPGKPLPDIDLEQVQAAAGIGCSAEEIAAVLKMSATRFYQRMREEPRLKEAMESGRENGRATLRRYQWQAAQGGNPALLIWLGKQLLGQKEGVVVAGDPNAPLVFVTGVVRRTDMEAIGGE